MTMTMTIDNGEFKKLDPRRGELVDKNKNLPCSKS